MSTSSMFSSLLDISPLMSALDMSLNSSDPQLFDEAAVQREEEYDRNDQEYDREVPEQNPSEDEREQEPDKMGEAERKRQKRARSAKEQTKNYAEKHPLLPVPNRCTSGCKKSCSTVIDENMRLQINRTVNNKDRETRHEWIRSHVKAKPVTSRRSVQKHLPSNKKNRAYEYSLPNGSDNVTVCKGFFLTTIGLTQNNMTPILTALDIELSSPSDKRGRHTPANKVDDDEIRRHIESMHPIKHHYRYSHAPNRRYLPADLTVQRMYAEFCRGQTASQCSLEHYRKVVRSMNISFTTLAGEECSRCSAHMKHMLDTHGISIKEPSEYADDCSQCHERNKHLKDAEEARKAYRADADAEWEEGVAILSADMMKVIVLPILPVKEAIFTKRLPVYNETFSLVMPHDKTKKENRKLLQRSMSACVIWHEGEVGRSAEDVAGAYVIFLEEVCRGVERVVIWADNCASQNKSWALMTALLKVVQSARTVTKNITMKYFEPGHTSMSADATHQVISKNLSKKGLVEDWRDYTDIVREVCQPIEMQPGVNMPDVTSGISQSRLQSLANEGVRPYLASFKVIQVRRESELLFTKTKLSAQTWKSYDLLRATVSAEEQFDLKRPAPNMDRQKIADICECLLPHITPHKRQFWKSLELKSGGKRPADGGTKVTREQKKRRT